MTRGRKSTVSMEQANDWLRKYEEDKTLTQLAEEEKHDPRTIKSHIDSAREERAKGRAREAVYKELLLKHYKDLYTFAQQLKEELAKPVPEPVPAYYRRSPFFKALKEHLPGISMWRKLHDWDKAAADYGSVIGELSAGIKQRAESITGMRFVTTESERGLSEGLVMAVLDVLLFTARGEVLEGVIEISTEAVRNGCVVSQNNRRLAFISSADESRFRDNYDTLKQEALRFSSYKTLRDVAIRHGRLKRYLEAELDKIILQRFVRGRCRYCPI